MTQQIDPEYMTRFRMGGGMKVILEGTKVLTQIAINESEANNPDRPPGDVQLMVMVMVIQKVGDQAVLELASSSDSPKLVQRMLERALGQVEQQISEEGEHGKH